MSETSVLEVSKLSLDLRNFRTVPQKKESDAVKAMIAISPDRFYAIMESIIEDGYIPTENIIVLEEDAQHIVKEGNRRIASLKLIQGHYKTIEFGIPTAIIDKISKLNESWKAENLSVPCTIFNKNEAEKADKVVALAHGKGEKASREAWGSVATARHNRDAKGIAEPALDLLEKYLQYGNNISNQLKDIWAGDYPLTVLHEAIRLIYSRLGFSTFSGLVIKYPQITGINGLDDLIRDVGLKQVQFKNVRDANEDFAVKYGLAPIVTPTVNTNKVSTSLNTCDANSGINNQSDDSNSTTNTNLAKQNSNRSPKSKAYASNDPQHIKMLLKKFNPSGDRSKIVTLRNEMRKLKIEDNPLAFCFILRSMFEISAKKYCEENGITLKKTSKGGKSAQDKSLADLLKDIYKNLVANDQDKSKTKLLHGAYTEITKREGILSVTSMNNLIHSPTFSVQPPDICTLFGNIFPLLESIN